MTQGPESPPEGEELGFIKGGVKVHGLWKVDSQSGLFAWKGTGQRYLLWCSGLCCILFLLDGKEVVFLLNPRGQRKGKSRGAVGKDGRLEYLWWLVPLRWNRGVGVGL
jgi:hypothetical protein